jgi:hypothetical protein
MKKDIGQLRETCETLWRDFNNCKAHFPHVPPEMKGAKFVETAPCYIAQGFNVTFEFSDGISEEGIKRINQISHWLNQNFIIRLCAVLESFGIIASSTLTNGPNKIDFNLEGAKHVNVVRRLRNCFVHTSGRYDPTDYDHRKTMKLISDTLGTPVDGLTDWPISINTVLKPLYDGCIKYAIQKSV